MGAAMTPAELQNANAQIGKFWWLPLLFSPVVVALAYPVVFDFENSGAEEIEKQIILSLIHAVAGRTGLEVFFGLGFAGCFLISGTLLALHVRGRSRRRRS